MPNYIYNVLEVHGKGENSQEDVVAFLKQHIRDNCFDFNTIIPEPSYEKDCPDEFNFNINEGRDACNMYTLENEDDMKWFNWYDWRYKYWGVKWNSGGNQFFDYDKILKSDTGISGEIRIVFETAWYPPLPVLKKLILMHPELEITCQYYSCESMVYGYVGKSFDRDDEVVHESYKINVQCQHDEIK